MSAPGISRIKAVTIAVKDQDEALAWYTDRKLGFYKRRRIFQFPGSGWVTVAPEQQQDVEFLLASWFPELIGRNGDLRPPHRRLQSDLQDVARSWRGVFPRTNDAFSRDSRPFSRIMLRIDMPLVQA